MQTWNAITDLSMKARYNVPRPGSLMCFWVGDITAPPLTVQASVPGSLIDNWCLTYFYPFLFILLTPSLFTINNNISSVQRILIQSTFLSSLNPSWFLYSGRYEWVRTVCIIFTTMQGNQPPFFLIKKHWW